MAETPRSPSEQPMIDPFESWRKLYDATEQAWTKAIKDMTTNPSYVEAQGKMLEVFLAYQKMVRDAMSTQLTSFNLPTRDDVSRLGELVVGLEEKVDQLQDQLDEMAEKPDEALQGLNKQVGRVEPIEKKVDKLDDRIGKLEEALVGLGQQLARIERHTTQLTTEGNEGAAETTERAKRPAAKGGKEPA